MLFLSRDWPGILMLLLLTGHAAGAQRECGAAKLSIAVCCRLLVESVGFEKTFLVTAAIKTFSYVALIPMLSLVPDGVCRRGRRAVVVPEAPLPVPTSTPEGNLQQPLLEGNAGDSLPTSTRR